MDDDDELHIAVVDSFYASTYIRNKEWMKSVFDTYLVLK